MTLSFDCRRTLDELQDWLRREVTPETAAAVEAHLALCEPCRVHVEFERRFQAVLSRASAGEQCPPEFRARLLAALQQEEGR